MSRAVFAEARTADPAAIRGGLRPDDVLTASGEAVLESLTRRGFQASWAGEAVPPTAIRAAYAFAYQTARTWFKDGLPQETLEYRGVNLGSCVQLSFGSYLARLLSEWVRIQAFVRGNNISEAVVLRVPVENPGSFYLGPCETHVPSILKNLAVPFTEEEAPIDERSRFDWRGVVKSLAAMQVPAFTRPRSLGAPVLFCAAPYQIQGLMDCFSKSHPILYLDESPQLKTRQELRGRYGAGYVRFDAWLRQSRAAQEREVFLERLTREWPEKLLALRKSRQWQFEGASIFELAAERMTWFASHKAAQLVSWIDAFYDLFEREPVQAVVLDEDVLEFRRTLASVARLCGVPSAVLLHAATPSFCDGFDMAPLTADKILVGGEGLREDCRAHGIDPERIVVTGIPRYESYVAADRPAVRRMLIQQGIPLREKAPLIALAATYFNDRFDPRGERRDIERAYRDFFSVIAARPALDVLVKRYPRDPEPGWIQQIANEAGARNIYFSSNEDARDISEVFSVCDAAVSFPSGTIVEAFLLNRPTMILDYFSRLCFSLLAHPMAEFSASCQADMNRILDGFIAPGSGAAERAVAAGQLLAVQWAGSPLRSSARIVECVDKLVSSNKRTDARLAAAGRP